MTESETASSARDRVAEGNKTEVVSELLSAGAAVDAADVTGVTAAEYSEVIYQIYRQYLRNMHQPSHSEGSANIAGSCWSHSFFPCFSVRPQGSCCSLVPLDARVSEVLRIREICDVTTGSCARACQDLGLPEAH